MAVTVVFGHVLLLTTLMSKVMAVGIPNICLGTPKTKDSWGVILRVQHNAELYTEYGPKCYLLRRWENTLSPYSMTCYKRADTSYLITLYHGNKVIDSALVEGCNKTDDLAGSVAIVPQEDASVFVVQYELSPSSDDALEKGVFKFCQQVTYNGERDRSAQDAECESLKRRQRTCRDNGSNGWKEKKVEIEGLVNSFVEINNEQCKYIRGWKTGVPDVLLQCYNCNEEMVAQIHFKGTTLVGTAVGTCESPVEGSFNVLQPKKDTPDIVKIQFWMRDGRCAKRSFDLKNKIPIGSAQTCKGSGKWSTSWRPLVTSG